MTKKKVEIGSSDPDRILEKLIEKHENETPNLMDGVKIDRSDSWVHIRKSNTEPIIRVISEARTKQASEALCKTFLQEMEKSAHI